MFPTTTTTGALQATAEQIEFRIPPTISICLSMFGCVVIILTYFLFDNLRTTPRKILVYISIGDFFTVFPYLLTIWNYPQSVEEYKYCVSQSFVTSTAVMWSFMWTSSLSVYLYMVLVKRRPDVAEKLMLPFNIMNWGAPLVLNGLALGFGALGSDETSDTGGWCWINGKMPKWKQILWMLACGKLCEIASYFINGIFYFLVTRKIKEVRERQYILSGQSIQTAIQGQRKLALAPVLFVFLRIWGTIRFIMLWSGTKSSNHSVNQFLLICHMIGDTLQGFVNFLLFCVFTKKFRENVNTICGCKSVSTQEENNSLFTRSNESIPEHQYIFKNPGPITFYT